jgi:hypothetical protein
MRFGISDRLSSLSEEEKVITDLIETLIEEPEVIETTILKKVKSKSRKRGSK